MTNMAIQQFAVNDRDLRLRKTFERLVLKRMIEQLRSDDLQPDLLCKMLHTYCELKKNDIAAEKVQTSDHPEKHFPSGPKDRAPVPESNRWEDFPRSVPFDIACPDAVVSTPDDFHTHLHDAIADIYRINAPNVTVPRPNQYRNPTIRDPPA